MEILYDDLGVILETSLQGCVERRIKTLTILAYDTGKKRFGVEDRKERRNTKQAPNSREQKIKHIRKELKDLSRRPANKSGLVPHKLIKMAMDDYYIPELIKKIVLKYFGGIQLRFAVDNKTTSSQNNIVIPYSSKMATVGTKRGSHLGRDDILAKEVKINDTEIDTEIRSITKKFQLKIQRDEIPTIVDNPIKCLGKWFHETLKDNTNVKIVQRHVLECFEVDKS
ncbi:Hypothetical predicted protein [Mytilus galloprovincialis]|uniref:Uncharacterized protein n=1 Tax=Mytilus galloprovincialis TaxID=29158 RepID=A0A8B6HG96_MYTGA|nr:Hypothetical predicted protein [Mytilus galloprovincialis]